QAGAQRQQIEPIVFGLTRADCYQSTAYQGGAWFLLQWPALSTADAKGLDVGQLWLTFQLEPELVCVFRDYGDPEILQDRNQFGEERRFTNFIEAQLAELPGGFRSGTTDQHAEAALM